MSHTPNEKTEAPANGQVKKDKYDVKLPSGETLTVSAGTPVSEILPKTNGHGQPIVAVTFNNKIASLERPVDRDGTIGFIDLASRDGGLIYRRSLTFLLIRAITELFPRFKVYINHSFGGGYYGEVFFEANGEESPQQLAERDIERIKERMSEIVAADEPFRREEVPISEAVKRFSEAGLRDKVELLRYRTSDVISIYHSGEMINHFYGQLLPSAGYLTRFDVKLCPPGFVLLFPPHGRINETPRFFPEDRMFAVLQEYEHWMRILGVRTVSHLNSLIDTREINEYVLIAEALHEKKIAQLADQICEHPRRPRVILLSGPSASGKTTTVKRLSIQLRVNGLRPLQISLDDFFVERDATPRDENGEFDFESVRAINRDLLQDCIQRLLNGDEVALPKFDFVKGKPVEGHRVRLLKGQQLVLEGIHALNPELMPHIPDGAKFKIYISPLTHLNIDDHNRIASSDARLIRRLVRDAAYRGYDGVATLKRWTSVRRGEERNIFPYQNEADFIFNSSLPYEICVLRKFAEPVLQSVPREEELYSEAARLLKFMSYFRKIDPNTVPRHSLLREFIGGSSFKY